jgi:RNA recognition motif. (a.k.a. RRM, RBD, or RNP domain)
MIADVTLCTVPKSIMWCTGLTNVVPIASCVRLQDDKGNSKGFGFINFERNDDAAAAVKELNGKDVKGKELFASRAQKKSERNAVLRAKFDEVWCGGMVVIR